MRWIHILLVGALAGALFCVFRGSSADNPTSQKSDPSSAVCPVVYSLDETPAERGYRYIFYGNAFFIDREGYLLTAAHVLSDFQNGGQPQILLRFAEAPPRLTKIQTVASDPLHDIAILRAVPNPFEHNRALAFLPLSPTKPVPGLSILALALRPAQLKDPHSFEAPQQDTSVGDVLQYTSIPLNKGQPKAELFLFNHEVLRGQSGAPILSRETQEVVGIVEGQWLHGIATHPIGSSGNHRRATLGAGVPIVYALRLLDEQKVPWQEGSGPSK